MANIEYKYYAFLSCSPQDNCEQPVDSAAAGRRCWGNWLADALKEFSIPPEFVGQINGRGEIIPERIAPVYRDESELPEPAGLSVATRQALEQSNCLIVICSPRSASSRQMNEVVRYFKQLGRGKRILPIVVAGEPNTGPGNPSAAAMAGECFVPALRHPVLPDGALDTTRRSDKHFFVDARHGVEKREILAEDQRAAEADLEMAKIQLIALLLGVGFNGLWWREQRRHFFDFAEARRQAMEALHQVAENQRQLAEAQQQIRAAQKQALELQNLPGDVQGQIQEAQTRTHEAQQQLSAAQQQLRELENKVRHTQGQLAESQQQAREIQTQLEETRSQVREAKNTPDQLQEFQNQARAAQEQLEAARAQLREAQDKVLAAQSQAHAAPGLLREIPGQNRNARRLTRVYALLAVLALVVAGLVANHAWQQQQIENQALAKAVAEASGTFDPAIGEREPVWLVLQKIGGAELAENRRRSLEHLAAAIPQDEISEALKAAPVIVADQQRSHFQKCLLVRLARVNPVAAMTKARALAGKIVNDEGVSDSSLYFQLAVLDVWMKTDLPGAFNWICQLPDDDSRQRALDQFIRALAARPDTESKRRLLRNCISELAKTDVSGALALAESLPESAGCNTMIARLTLAADPFVISEWINRLSLPPEIMVPRQAAWTGTKFFQNANFGRWELWRPATERLSASTNGPVRVPPPS